MIHTFSINKILRNNQITLESVDHSECIFIWKTILRLNDKLPYSNKSLHISSPLEPMIVVLNVPIEFIP